MKMICNKQTKINVCKQTTLCKSNNTAATNKPIHTTHTQPRQQTQPSRPFSPGLMWRPRRRHRGRGCRPQRLRPAPRAPSSSSNPGRHLARLDRPRLRCESRDGAAAQPHGAHPRAGEGGCRCRRRRAAAAARHEAGRDAGRTPTTAAAITIAPVGGRTMVAGPPPPTSTHDRGAQVGA